MREGPRLPTAEAAITLPFGRGIHLTDSFSRAAGVSCTEKQGADSNNNFYGVVFLCEAALGEMHRAYEPD